MRSSGQTHVIRDASTTANVNPLRAAHAFQQRPRIRKLNPVHTIGLTGGIASGKSTVTRMFGELGIPCVDADQIAREVMEPGTDGLRAVVEAFGEEVVSADGSLDRKKLGALVFANPGLRDRLNAIVHPLIRERSAERLVELAQPGAPYVLYDAALLVENNLHQTFDALVVVRSSPEIQRQRLRERDGLSDEEIDQRLAAQMPEDEKAQAADYTIDNSGTLDETRAQVVAVDAALRQRFQRGES